MKTIIFNECLGLITEASAKVTAIFVVYIYVYEKIRTDMGTVI